MRPDYSVRALIIAAALAAGLTSLTADQNVVISGPIPALENRELPKGTGLVIGRVIDADAGTAVAGAIVFLNLAAGTGATPVMTDDRGRFVFSELPKGAYTLRSVKAGYVGGAYAKRLPEEEPGRDGRPLVLAEDERLGDVTLRMWRHAALGGTVVDEAGEPVVGINVRAVPRRIVAGRSQFLLDYSAPNDRTDDRGLFRLSSLVPGDYLVAVPNVTGAVPKQRPTSPAPSSLNESSSGGLRWILASGSLRTGGIDVGDDNYLLVVGGSGAPRMPGFAGIGPDGRVLGYETQFYPGVASIARATVVSVKSGEDRSGIDFQLRAAPTFRISGTITGFNGPPGELMLRLVSAETAAMMARDPEIAQTVSAADGQFAFLGVPPGDYSVRVARTPRPAPSPNTTNQVTVLGPAGSSSVILDRPSSRAPLPDTPTLWAETPISVSTQDVSDVTLTLRAGARIKGSVEFAGGTPPLLDGLSVFIERADGVEPANVSALLGRIDDQNNLTTYGQPPGKYFVRVPYNASNWSFRGAMLGDRDVFVVPLELTDQDVTGVVLKFSDRPPSEISGVVKADRGQSADGAMVIVFPEDRQFWANTGMNPRNLRSVGTASDGKFSVTDLPPASTT